MNRYLKSISRKAVRGSCRAFGAFGAVCAGFPCDVLAQAAVAEPGLALGSLLQTVLALALVIGILFLAAYLLRKFNGGHGFGGNGPLRLVGGLMIGTRERIVVVEVGDTWLVVGIVPGHIRTLHTLPKGELSPRGDGEKLFAQWLKQITERKNEGS